MKIGNRSDGSYSRKITGFVSYFFVIMVALAVIIGGYKISLNIVKKQINIINERILTAVCQNMDSFFLDLSEKINYLMLNKYVSKISRYDYTEDGARNYDEWLLQQEFKDMVLTNHNFESIFAYFPQHSKVVSSQGNMTPESYYELCLNNDGMDETAFLELLQGYHHKDFYSLEKGTQSKLVCLSSNSLFFYDKTEYIIGIVIDYDVLRKIMQETKWNQEIGVYVLDRQNRVIFDESGSEREPATVLSRESQFMDYTYYTVIPDTVYSYITSRLQIYYVAMLFLFFLFGTLLSYYLTVRNYNPIQIIVNVLNRYGKPDTVSGDEYQWIQSKLNLLLDDYSTVQRSLEKRVNTLRGYQLIKLLEYNYETSEVNMDDLKNNGIELENPFNLVVLFKLENPVRQETDDETDRDARLLNELIITNVFYELVSGSFVIYMTPMGKYIAAVINMEDSSSDNDEIIQNQIEVLQSFAAENYQLSVTALVGESLEGLEGIHASYIQARDMEKYVPLLGSQLIVYDDVETVHKKNYYYSISSKQKLIHAVSCADTGLALKLIDDIVEDALQRNMSPVMFQCLLYGLIEAIFFGVEDSGISRNEVEYDMEKQFHMDHSISCLKQELKELTVHVCALVQNKISGMRANDDYDEKVREYIKGNFKNSDLNISMIAYHFNLTPTYMSTVIKKQCGISLLEYINDMRLDFAMELLKTDVTVADVAEKAGFRNSASYIRVFKKKYGITPGQMRDKLGRK